MMLQIGEVQKEDFGTYKCIAKNPRGQTDGQITLTGKIYFRNNNLHCVFLFFTHFAFVRILPYRCIKLFDLNVKTKLNEKYYIYNLT